MRTAVLCSAVLLSAACMPSKAAMERSEPPFVPPREAVSAPEPSPMEAAPSPQREPSAAPAEAIPAFPLNLRVVLPLPHGWEPWRTPKGPRDPNDDLLVAYERSRYEAVVMVFPALPDVDPEKDIDDLRERWEGAPSGARVHAISSDGTGRRWYGVRRNLEDPSRGLVYCEMQAYVDLAPDADATVLVLSTWFSADDGLVQRELIHALDALEVVVLDDP